MLGHHLLPSDIGTPGSLPFELGPGFIIGSPGCQAFRLGLEIHPQFSWASSLQIANQETSQPPKPHE